MFDTKPNNAGPAPEIAPVQYQSPQTDPIPTVAPVAPSALPKSSEQKIDTQTIKKPHSSIKWTLFILFILLLVASGGVLYFAVSKGADLRSLSSIKNSFTSAPATDDGPADNSPDIKQTCETDTKTCPDGTVLKRKLPDCGFGDCPTDDSVIPDKASSTKTEETACIPKGGIISTSSIMNGNPGCCFGLRLILSEPDRFNYGYCLSCGNLICEENENKLNCPSDCPLNSFEATEEEMQKDSDADGLLDFEEPWYATDPNKADTDSDGYSDGDELRGVYNPRGLGAIIADYKTPEGAILSYEQAKANCDFSAYDDKFYFSEQSLERFRSLAQIYNETEFMNIEDLKDRMVQEFIETNIFINKIDKISFLARKPIDKHSLILSYKVSYLADERGYVPSTKSQMLILTNNDGEWLFDLGALMMDGYNNGLTLENAQEKSRNARRIADVKQMQTAVELYFNDCGRYPEKIVPGGQIAMGDGICEGTNVYMATSPLNPQPSDPGCPENSEYSYRVMNNGQAYELIYCISLSIGDIPSGVNIATPSGTSKRSDNRSPIYKRCYSDTASRDKARISDIKQIQTALELYYNDEKSYPKEIKAGEPIEGSSTYMSVMPNNPDYSSKICGGFAEYQYTQTDGGQTYELRYCLEEEVGAISAGPHIASPAGISE